MTKTLDLAMRKAAGLPEPAQEQLGRELLMRIDTLEELRAEIAVGVRELDAGGGTDLEIEDMVRQLHRDHGAG